MNISELYGKQEQLFERLMNNFSFAVHVSLICSVQSYDAETQTIEAQPVIRERVVGEGSKISFVNYPLLINVPVAFPQSGDYAVTFPISVGDECLVVFNDLPYDFWWRDGGIQNPVEQRRHDLSDGIAIFGVMNQRKLSRRNVSPPQNAISIMNTNTGAGISISSGDGRLMTATNAISFSEIINKLENL